MKLCLTSFYLMVLSIHNRFAAMERACNGLIMRLLSHESKITYSYLLKWSVLAPVSGVLCSSIVCLFSLLISSLNTFAISTAVHPVLWCSAGAAIVTLIIYKLRPDAIVEGIPSYIKEMCENNGCLPAGQTIMKFAAAVITLGTFGSGGVVGPLGRITAGAIFFTSKGFRKIGFSKNDMYTASICGMAAGVGAIFHSPIGGGIFAVEVIRKARLGYKSVFPAILASTAAVVFSKSAGWDAIYSIDALAGRLNFSIIHLVLIVAILSGLVGNGFENLYALLVRALRRGRKPIFLKALAGSAAACICAGLINPDLLSTSQNLFSLIMKGELVAVAGNLSGFMPLAAALFIIMVLKLTFNCITVGSGMSAGFTGPAVLAGMLLGASVATVSGIPPATPEFHALVAAGFAGILASAMNVPLGAAVITAEVFGTGYSASTALSAIIAFQLSRSGTIHEYAISESEFSE